MPAASDEIHVWIQQGAIARARTEVQALAERGPSREEAVVLAGLSVRVGLPELGARLLHRFVRPPPRTVSKPSDVEKAEYAHCLIRAGAVDEGMGLLSRLDASQYPPVHFYRAAGFVARWNYRESIEPLRQYVAAKELPHYQCLVGKVNLAAALIFEGKQLQATALLRELLHSGSVERYRLLLGRVLELSAEHFIAQRQWDEAERFLVEAERRLAKTQGVDELFVKKFRAVLAARKRPEDDSAMEVVRAEATRLQHWETVRDCDRIRALARHDARLLAQVYFGTPFPSYREKLLAAFGEVPPSVIESYLWTTDDRAVTSRSDRWDFDLFQGKLASGSEVLKPGTLPHRLLVGLLADFYRPLRLADLHARAQPDVPFDPTRSAAALHDGLARLREAFEKHGVPLQVVAKGGTYVLVGKRRFTIRLATDALLGRRYGTDLRKLHAAWPEVPFSIAEAVKMLGCPRRTALRLLQDAVDQRLLTRTGQARATRYAFPLAPKK